ncbi:hypothetical protein BGZ83_011869 [Gryganskiella cystojenkinii]|nr:hypothetical protein BGZ83_011869 [Gryganskiella cystojenkinii]
MNLPEISILVGRLLDGRTLASCVRVCKNWHETFIPLLYQTYNSCEFEEISSPWSLFEFGAVGTEYNDKEVYVEDARKVPSDIALQRYGCNIKELYVNLPCSAAATLAVTTGHIMKLRIVGLVDFDQFTLQNQPELQLLVTNNPGIERLELRRFTGPWGSKCIRQLSQKCLQLKEVSVEESTFDLSDLVSFQECLKLSTIQIIDSAVFVPEESSIRIPTLPSLKTLELKMNEGLGTSIALEMAAHWPQLESLSLISPSEYNSPRFQTYPQLSRLHLMYLTLEDLDLVHLLSRCPRLSDLTLYDQPLRKEVFAALTGLTGTLTSLALYEAYDEDYTEPDTWRQRQLLCFLPNLINFACSTFDVDEAFSCAVGDETLPERGDENEVVTNPRLSAQESTLTQAHWACTNLQTLRTFQLDLSSNPDKNKAAKDQLSALHDLEYFYAKQSYRKLPRFRCTFRDIMESGPDKYGSEHLDRCDLVQDPELQWIVKAWPRIQYYAGPRQFGTDPYA